MSFFKYYRERQDADGEPLWWPGGPEGFPFRGRQPPQTTRSEYENLRLSGKARVRLFYLARAEEMDEYIRIRDKCANGLYILLDRERIWDEETKNYRIFLEWLELGYDMPPTEGVTDAIANYTQSQSAILPYNRLAGVRSGKGGW